MSLARTTIVSSSETLSALSFKRATSKAPVPFSSIAAYTPTCPESGSGMRCL